MSYLNRFSEDDIFFNTITTHPQYELVGHSGSQWINNRVTEGDNYTAGTVNLYEGVSGSYPFAVKDGGLTVLATTDSSTFNSAQYGDTLNGTYPLTASISRDYIDNALSTDPKIESLQNTLNYYKFQSQAYDYSNYSSGLVNLISVPSIIFGSSIRRGSLDLKFFYTGSLIGRAQDIKRNGELVETIGDNSGSVIGTVLYNEGFILLSSSADISDNVDSYAGNIAAQLTSKWTRFMSHDTGPDFPSASSFSLAFEGSQVVPTMTMFTHAKEGHLNSSQNPTYISHGQVLKSSGSSVIFKENEEVSLTNTVESPFCSGSADFRKQTFINKVGIYDENENLIAIAKLATPLRKTEDIGHTIKIRLDL
jgi:hypothetical protein